MSRAKFWIGFGLCAVFYLVMLLGYKKDLKEFAAGVLVFLAAMAGAEQWRDSLRQKALAKVEDHLITAHKMVDALRHIASAVVEYRKEGDDSGVAGAAYDRQKKMEHNSAIIEALYSSLYEMELYFPGKLAENTKELKKIFHEICAAHRSWLAMRSVQADWPTILASYNKAFLQEDSLSSKLNLIEGELITMKKKIWKEYYAVVE